LVWLGCCFLLFCRLGVFLGCVVLWVFGFWLLGVVCWCYWRFLGVFGLWGGWGFLVL